MCSRHESEKGTGLLGAIFWSTTVICTQAAVKKVPVSIGAHVTRLASCVPKYCFSSPRPGTVCLVVCMTENPTVITLKEAGRGTAVRLYARVVNPQVAPGEAGHHTNAAL